MKWKIGNVEIINQVCLAPMAGITNNAFRSIVKEMGCGLLYTEMVSDKAIYYGNQKTTELFFITQEERPIAVQIFGSDIESFVYAAKYVYEKVKPDIIDINMGCPVPKVALKSQAGAALLKDPTKIYDIVKKVVQEVPCPVSVKIRSGWDKQSNAKEVAKVCEKAGASAICVHARSRNEGYNAKADWNIIKEVKEVVSIPVIGNGDIKSPLDAKRMLDETKCDAIMIGRATLGNPWIIKQTIQYLNTNKYQKEVTVAEKIDMCIDHFHRLIKLKTEKTALLEIRSHAAWYLKGLPQAISLKRKIFETKRKDTLLNLLNNYKNNYKIR